MWLKHALTLLIIIGVALTISALPQSTNNKNAPATQNASGANFATLPPGPMMDKATTACTECHEARIILQQRLSKAAWTKEVDKMIKWGAVVDAADRDALVDYLSTNFSPDKPPYEPERTATVDKKGKASK